MELRASPEIQQGGIVSEPKVEPRPRMDGSIINDLQTALSALEDVESRQSKRLDFMSANEMEDLLVRLSLARVTIQRALNLKLAGDNVNLIQSAMNSAGATRLNISSSYDTTRSLRYFSGR